MSKLMASAVQIEICIHGLLVYSLTQQTITPMHLLLFSYHTIHSEKLK